MTSGSARNQPSGPGGRRDSNGEKLALGQNETLPAIAMLPEMRMFSNFELQQSKKIDMVGRWL